MTESGNVEKNERQRQHQELLAASILGPLIAAHSTELFKMSAEAQRAQLAELLGLAFSTTGLIMAYGRQPGEDD